MDGNAKPIMGRKSSTKKLKDVSEETKKDSKNQAYDNILKRTLEARGKEMLPHLLNLDGLEILEEENIEALFPPRRYDRVYRSVYQNEQHITHIELEVSPKTGMDDRLL